MGYDMNTLGPGPSDLDEKVAEARATWRAALDRMHAAPDGPEKEALRAKALELPDPWDADPRYFRANIWGMGDLRDVMEKLGMIHWEHAGIPERVRLSDAQCDRLNDIYDRDGMRAYNAAHLEMDPALSWAPEVPAMCGWKFTSNDPWLITPVEIQCALKTYDDIEANKVATVLSEIDKDWFIDFWKDWIEYLRFAADNGGIVQG